MVTVRLARMAMASRYELVLQGEDDVWLRAAGEEALGEIERLDGQLSFYKPSSEISHINARAAKEAVPVEPRLFRLLLRAKALHEQTGGTFDITMGPLMRCWGFVRGTGRMPSEAELAEARARSGMQLVALDERDSTIRFEREGVEIDLGAIGKGYAIDEAVQLLREAGVDRAFLHGGTSTMYAIGRPAEQPCWNIAVTHPEAMEAAGGRAEGEEGDVLAVVPLVEEALSVSAVWGKAFSAEGRTFGHVLDPRSGRPVSGAVLTAVAHPSATDADALSTALLVLGEEGESVVRRNFPELRALQLLPQPGGGYRRIDYGIAMAS